MGPLMICKAVEVIKTVKAGQGGRLGDLMGSTGRFEGSSDD